jgi:predicted N-acyltransferase
MQRGKVDREQWNSVVSNSREGTFFHSFEWIEVIRIYGEKTGFYVPWHICVKNIRLNEIVGILPLFLDNRHRLVSLPFGDYGGPCLTPRSNKNEILKLLFKEAEETARKEARETRLKSLPEDHLTWVRTLRFSVTPFMYTFLLPINDLAMDDLWRKFRRDTRRGIRKGREMGLVIEEAWEKRAMKEYYQIYSISMKNMGVSVRPYAFFEALWDALSQRRLLHVLLVHYKNSCIAGLIFFSWKKRVYIYGNASLPQYRKLRANDLLYYEVIRWGVERNFHVVDFGLTPLNRNSGLYQFKKRWGGAPTLLFLSSKKYGLWTRARDFFNKLSWR